MTNLYTETKIISSPEKIKELFDTFFAEKTADIKYSGKELKVKCYSFINGKAVIGIPFTTTIPEPVMIFNSQGNKTVHLALKKAGNAGEENTFFDITKCILIESARSANRHQISHNKDQKKVVYITDFINDTIVENSISFESKRINAIFARAEAELLKHFLTVRFVIKNEMPHDLRMQYILKNRTGIIIRKSTMIILMIKRLMISILITFLM